MRVGLALQHGHTYVVKVDAYNGAGRSSTTATSTVYVDTTAPDASAVSVYDELDGDFGS